MKKAMKETEDKRKNIEINKRKSERTKEQRNDRTNKQTNERTNERTNEGTNERQNERTDKRTHERQNERDKIRKAKTYPSFESSVGAVFFDAATLPFVFPFPPALAFGLRLDDDGKSWQIGIFDYKKKNRILSRINALTQQQKQQLKLISSSGCKPNKKITRESFKNFLAPSSSPDSSPLDRFALRRTRVWL